MQEFFNIIFKEYGELAGFKPPKLVFTDLAEDTEINAKSAIDLFSSGLITQDEGREMIGLKNMPDGTGGELRRGLGNARWRS